ncbi:hypothetical protein CW304_32805 [Bacillus sp. UFRGS-B20]|nr:hypothetical protein CW304_32805 [Bacillus sp. UFRGS-B20]
MVPKVRLGLPRGQEFPPQPLKRGSKLTCDVVHTLLGTFPQTHTKQPIPSLLRGAPSPVGQYNAEGLWVCGVVSTS